jgi:small GTP-binding protein
MSAKVNQTVIPTPSEIAVSSPPYLLIGIFAIAVLALFFIFKKKGGSSRRNATTLFIIGECGSGKTSLLYYLENKTNQRTTSSMKENDVSLSVPLSNGGKTEIPCVDVPGHHHLRNILFDRLNEAKGLIVTVDSSDKASIAGVADYLYKVLINPVFRNDEIPTLVVLNKQDLAASRKINIIEEELANEIEKLKISKRAIHEENEEEDWLKQNFNKFSFAGTPVKFCEASVNKGEIDQVVQFVQNLVE